MREEGYFSMEKVIHFLKTYNTNKYAPHKSSQIYEVNMIVVKEKYTIQQ